MAKSKNSKDLSKDDSIDASRDDTTPGGTIGTDTPEIGTEDTVAAGAAAEDTVPAGDDSPAAGTAEDRVDPLIQPEPGADHSSAAELVTGDTLAAGDTGTTEETAVSSDAVPEGMMSDDMAGDETLAGGNDSTDAARDAEPEPLFPKDPESVAPAAAVPPQVVKETVVQKRGGFVPMFLGGVVAAGAGFLAAQYESNDWPFAAPEADTFRAETQAALADQQGAVDALGARVGTVETSLAGIDLSGVEGQLDGLSTDLAALKEQVAANSDQIGLLEVRVVTLEKAPIAETVSPEAIAAYERELNKLSEEIAQQRTEIETMAADAVAAEENANTQAELAKARAALAELTAALESGAPFSEAIGKITETEDVAVPEALSAVSDEGVPSLTELNAAFPDAARAALAAARDAGVEAEESGKLMGFLREQLGARSVTPQEGDGPDAVLSRAEAAVRAGDLETALAELDTLPEPAKAAMSGWISQARMRVAAQAAAASLSQELNKQ